MMVQAHGATHAAFRNLFGAVFPLNSNFRGCAKGDASLISELRRLLILAAIRRVAMLSMLLYKSVVMSISPRGLD